MPQMMTENRFTWANRLNTVCVQANVLDAKSTAVNWSTNLILAINEVAINFNLRSPDRWTDSLLWIRLHFDRLLWQRNHWYNIRWTWSKFSQTMMALCMLSTNHIKLIVLRMTNAITTSQIYEETEPVRNAPISHWIIKYCFQLKKVNKLATTDLPTTGSNTFGHDYTMSKNRAQ